MESVNLFRIECAYDDDDPPGYAAGYARLAEQLGSARIGGTVYELRAGQSICPYHYEYGNEEWLVVLTGRPTLRTPEGERELEPGDVVCFREGPEGAHKVTNGDSEAVRVLMLSTKSKPDVSVYPDSGKIGVYPGNQDDTRIFLRDSGVEYFEGEL